MRYALTQAALRVPWLRGMVAAPPLLNPKALALFLGAAARGGDSAPRTVRERDARDLISLLDSTRSDEGGWGYPFPWQSRYFWAPAGSMNAVVTATVGWLAFDAADRLSMPAARSLALHACDQIAGRLHRSKVGSGVALSYTPGDQTRVVNISALCARLLARGESESPDHGSLAGSLMAFVHEAQRADGSWPYALDRGAEWEDSFHTGYVLEALLDVDRFGGPAPEESLDRGFAAYRRFFDEDGGPRLRATAASPYDAHSAAQGILTYSALAASRFDRLAERERAGERAAWIAS
ncbi:MAG TPA: hypothetical protein VFM17_06080, partial [Candidatus Eisenbacteria bacterium]|nr:hypothetical protein [Candidatus Eisenbacteria bacterium]